MKFSPVAVILAAVALPAPVAAQWRIEDATPAQPAGARLLHERKIVSPEGEGGFLSSRRIDVIWFRADQFTFRVIDNGPTSEPAYPSLAAALEKNGCAAGCNGGFFLKSGGPSGLMIADGRSTGRFGSGSLLSGVVLTDGEGRPRLLRRSQYDASLRATDLIQAGPFLVDRGETVRGLSDEKSRRRTFVLHDGDAWFAVGMSESLTLADLGQILADPAFSPSRSIHRALNLDGGTSSGLYLRRGNGDPELSVEPFKTVRNFVGIVARRSVP